MCTAPLDRYVLVPILPNSSDPDFEGIRGHIVEKRTNEIGFKTLILRMDPYYVNQLKLKKIVYCEIEYFPPEKQISFKIPIHSRYYNVYAEPDSAFDAKELRKLTGNVERNPDSTIPYLDIFLVFLAPNLVPKVANLPFLRNIRFAKTEFKRETIIQNLKLGPVKLSINYFSNPESSEKIMQLLKEGKFEGSFPGEGFSLTTLKTAEQVKILDEIARLGIANQIITQSSPSTPKYI